MSPSNKGSAFLIVTTCVVLVLALSACGGFGGRYKIKGLQMQDTRAHAKIPLNIRLVLDSKLCSYTYTSIRQGAKRFYELGDALCANSRNLFALLFNNLTVVSNKNEGSASDFDATAHLRVIDTSVLVRPGAPGRFEATIIYECSIMDKNSRTIFLRTLKENKIYRGYGYGGYGIVMQQAVDELFATLENELASSPELAKLAKSLK